jgi:hypothetical protein
MAIDVGNGGSEGCSQAYSAPPGQLKCNTRSSHRKWSLEHRHAEKQKDNRVQLTFLESYIVHSLAISSARISSWHEDDVSARSRPKARIVFACQARG